MRCFVDDVSSYDAQQELTPQFQVEHDVDCVRVSLLLIVAVLFSPLRMWGT